MGWLWQCHRAVPASRSLDRSLRHGVAFLCMQRRPASFDGYRLQQTLVVKCEGGSGGKHVLFRPTWFVVSSFEIFACLHGPNRVIPIRCPFQVYAAY